MSLVLPIYLFLLFIKSNFYRLSDSKFSYLAKFITDDSNLSIPVFEIFIKECRLIKSKTDNPEENFAELVVGKM